MARKKTASASFANAFGALGYCSLVLQWLWTFLITLYPLIVDPPAWVRPATSPYVSQEPMSVELPDAATAIMMAITMALVLAVSIYMLVTLPKRIGKTGQAMVQKAATAIVPIVTERRKISEKKRRKITTRTILVIKLLAIATPLLAPYFLPGTTPLDPEVVAVLGIFGAATSTLLFGLQYLIARITRASSTLLW